MNEPTSPPRAIRSFVRRAGRITPGQQRALEALWPRYGLDVGAGLLDFGQIFGRTAPVVLEIGFGNGEQLLARAMRAPECSFLGIEVHEPGVGHLLLAAERAELSNLRVIRHDAVEVLQGQIPVASLDEVQILFPDPWPKKRHHKRRLIQPAFIETVARCLQPEGLLHLATDWAPYAEHMREVLAACPKFTDCSTDSVQNARLPERVATRFERRGTRLGHRVQDLLYRRMP
ncbi:MAG: tRNA (guanosine(46)-N7)-methyltransferase TrmB [Steroidobacteraceae bacterium]|jgi:tRNA (guanine-N7-)-methyltransferase